MIMPTTTIKRELEELKERQIKLEQAFYKLFGNEFGREGKLKLSYLKKLERIRRNMKEGRGISIIRNRRELRDFFRSL
jgi:hypothetical protein